MDEIDKAGLLPCPWCGTKPDVEPWHRGAPTKVMVWCQNENCDVAPGVTSETPTQAASCWNTHVQQAERAKGDTALVEELEAWADRCERLHGTPERAALLRRAAAALQVKP